MASVSVPAWADVCKPAQLDPAMTAPPATWQPALDELLAASSDASQPWGCPDSRLRLAVPAGQSHAFLSVKSPDGRIARRMIGAPADLVAAGKALLARVDLSASAAELPTATTEARLDPVPAQPIAVDVPDHGDEPAAASAPRAYFDGQATGRYAGGVDGVMVGGTLRATLPVGPWLGGLWGRYAALAHAFSSEAQELFVGELAVGLVGGYPLVEEPVRLDIGVTGSLAILNMSGETPGATEADEQEAEAGSADGRLGSERRLGIPLSSSWHGLATLDAEFAPGAFAGEEARQRAEQPEAAATAARDYLDRYPEGYRRDEAKTLAGPKEAGQAPD